MAGPSVDAAMNGFQPASPRYKRKPQKGIFPVVLPLKRFIRVARSQSYRGLRDSYETFSKLAIDIWLSFELYQ
jgi:hypothetical protein